MTLDNSILLNNDYLIYNNYFGFPSTKAGNVKKILLSKKFVFKNKSNEINLNSDLEKSNIRTGKLFFRISSDENYLNKIEKIDLKIIPNYNLNNFKVLEKNNNCYFLEKLS